MDSPFRINTSTTTSGNADTSCAEFGQAASRALGGPLRAMGIEIIQANIGHRCNLSCAHCHIEGGPSRSDTMAEADMQYILKALAHNEIKTLDITGGAPEMNPVFRPLLTGAGDLGKHVMVRTNMAIFFEDGFQDLPDFYAENSVELIASMPCYSQGGVDPVRGEGVFAKSIDALRKLNALGYGRGRHTLNLVYNPGGAFLPPPQEKLEADYKRQLQEKHDVHFDRLFTFTNMPIGRFRGRLESSGELLKYEGMLAEAFNPATVEGVMCRRLINVAPDGSLFDCDFNQAISLGLEEGMPRHISSFDYEALAARRIAVGQHCYGCTAGSGSSCRGAVA